MIHKQTAYSSHKAAHYHKELAQFRDDDFLGVYPRQIQIDPFNPCNHDCPFCVYRYHRDDDINALFSLKDWIRTEKMLEIFDSCVEMGTKGVEITGGGEPTLHPEILTVIDGLFERDLELGLITNGCGKHWTKHEDALSSLAGGGAWVRFSVDSACAETHSAVHATEPSDFRRVCTSIRNTVDKKRPETIVGFSFVVTHQNYQDIRDAAKIAKDLGVDNIRYSAAIFEGRPDGYHHDHYDEACRLLELAKQEGTHDFSVFTFAPERMVFREAFGNYEEGDTCFYSGLNAVIGADLNLYPCCVLKYRPHGVVASLKKQSFKAAWESQQRAAYYQHLDLANGCKTCYLKPKNDFIKYLVEPEPLHLNFI